MQTKQPCRFWEKCFRKDQLHLNEFVHPADVMIPVTMNQGAGMMNPGQGMMNQGAMNNGGGMMNPGAGMGNQGAVMGNPGGAMGNPGGAMGNQGGAIVNPGAGMVNSGAGMVNPGGGMVNPGGGMVNPGGGMVSQGGGMVSQGGGMVSQGGGMVSQGGGIVSQGGGMVSQAAPASSPPPPLMKTETLELPTNPPETKPIVEVERKGIKRKTHEMSLYEDDPEAAALAKKKKEEEQAAFIAAGVRSAIAKMKGKPRMRCQFWESCYRKDMTHKKLYVHPGDPDEEEAVEPRTRGSNRPTPLNRIDSMKEVKIGDYTLKRMGNAYTCTCEAYKGYNNMSKPKNERTCSHLVGFLGEEFERARCKLPPKGKPLPLAPHIQVNVLLAHKYTEGEMDPTHWWMSEKLDGIRAYWNGRCFYSRLGNAFFAPDWFTQNLPKDMHLDGELFGGRKKFHHTSTVVKHPDHKDWDKLFYHVFDAPHLEKQPFEMRTNAIKECFDKLKPPYAKLVEQTKCLGPEHINKEMERIIALGGEGLMIRKPGSTYERRRSKTLLKVKKFYDAEGLLVDYETSKNGHGRTAALWLQMANGKKFKVGSGMNNYDRKHPPVIGTIITYKFQEYTDSGIPRFPTYVGPRIDMTEPKDAEGVVMTAVNDD